MYVRMALILTLLGGVDGYPTVSGARMFEWTCKNPRPNGTVHCKNPKCVSNLDLTLPIRVYDANDWMATDILNETFTVQP